MDLKQHLIQSVNIALNKGIKIIKHLIYSGFETIFRRIALKKAMVYFNGVNGC